MRWTPSHTRLLFGWLMLQLLAGGVFWLAGARNLPVFGLVTVGLTVLLLGALRNLDKRSAREAAGVLDEIGRGRYPAGVGLGNRPNPVLLDQAIANMSRRRRP